MKVPISIIVLTFSLISLSTGCRQIFGDREQPESILQVTDEVSEIIVTAPPRGSIWKPGEIIRINWYSDSVNSVDLELYRKSDYQSTIIQNLKNSGMYEWKIPININLSNQYLIKVINHNNPDVYQFSEGSEFNKLGKNKIA